MFANLQVLLPGAKPRCWCRQTAITYTLYGNSVYVGGAAEGRPGKAAAKDDKGQPLLVVERRFVETGERRDGLVVIRKGPARPASRWSPPASSS